LVHTDRVAIEDAAGPVTRDVHGFVGGRPGVHVVRGRGVASVVKHVAAGLTPHWEAGLLARCLPRGQFLAGQAALSLVEPTASVLWAFHRPTSFQCGVDALRTQPLVTPSQEELLAAIA